MNLRTVVACVLLIAASAAPAKHFRWTSQGDAYSMDPHGQTETFTDSIVALSYEYLVTRGKDHSIVPQLAVSWSNPEPTRWIFHLRRDVRFHDGTPFTADDVVFSLKRARESRTVYRLFGAQVGTPRAIDDHTVEFVTPLPNPAMLDYLGVLFMMSKAWAEKHGVAKARDPSISEETYATRNANGTGPYILASYQPGVKTEHRKNPDWWGLREGRFEGNVETVEFRPIANAATRLAALISGQVDFVLDPPVQDLPRLRRTSGIRVWEGDEMRVTFLMLDMNRDDLLYSDVKGRNPFKDRRVRLALYQAIDVEALRTQVMRGLAVPTAIALPAPLLLGLEDGIAKRHPFNPARARQLLAEAGYPRGFAFRLLCTTDRLINDEKLCFAIAAMWARIGVDVKVDALPKAQVMPRARTRDFTALLTSWGSVSEQAIFTLRPILRSPDERGAGVSNLGWRNPELDRLIDLIEVELDAARRNDLLRQAVHVMHEEIYLIPIHRQKIPWASRGNVSVVHTPHNWLVPIWIKVADPR